LAYEGTLWEVVWLREAGLLPRTLFVMPVSLRRKQQRHYEESWGAASKRLREADIHLPEYQAAGKVFTVGTDGHAADSWELNMKSPRNIRKGVKRVFVEGQNYA